MVSCTRKSLLVEERFEKLKNDLGTLITAERHKKIRNLLRNWSQDDLSYLVFYPEPKYLATDISIRDEEYNISRELINKMSELENLSIKISSTNSVRLIIQKQKTTIASRLI